MGGGASINKKDKMNLKGLKNRFLSNIVASSIISEADKNKLRHREKSITRLASVINDIEAANQITVGLSIFQIDQITDCVANLNNRANDPSCVIQYWQNDGRVVYKILDKNSGEEFVINNNQLQCFAFKQIKKISKITGFPIEEE